MANLTFDPTKNISARLKNMSPSEAINLGIALCLALENGNYESGFHGSIWPGNVTYFDKTAALGPVSQAKLKEMSPDALEYIAPEQFWNGESSPAADVYSIGLVLFTALNGGVMPFFEEKDSYTAEDRAAALQKRMRGAELPYPKFACRELGDVILTAMSFKAEERYSGAASLRQALEALPESAAIPAMAPVIRLHPSQVENVHSYKVDKNFEKTTQAPAPKAKKVKDQAHVDENMDVQEFRKPKKKKNWILPILLIAVIAAAVLLISKGCSDEPDEPDLPGSSEINNPIPDDPTDPVTTPVPTVDISIQTPEPSEEPTPTPTPEPRYTVILDDVTWEEAKANCEAMGGHLATVNSQEELDKLTAMAEEKGASFVWLGSYRGADGVWYHVTGETVEFFKWDSGEPSVQDADGTPESYLLLWYRAAAGYWSYNDMRNDPISVLPRTYSGKTAYICQFD